jgi:hypothetical protein
MIGSRATTRSGVCTRALALRSAISAIMVPNTVVPVAVHRARNSVFQATPQRSPPARQFSPQTRSLPMRSCSASKDHWPCSLRNAPCSALTTGNAMNSSSSTEQPTTAEATNRSPLKNPSRATPEGRDHHQRQQGHERTDTDAELVERQFAEPAVEDLERPAFGADHEAAGQQSAETQYPAREEPASLCLARWYGQADGGHNQPQHAQQQPDAVRAPGSAPDRWPSRAHSGLWDSTVYQAVSWIAYQGNMR